MTQDDAAGPVRLRAFTEDDLPFLDRLCTDPDVLGEFEWPGFIDPRTRYSSTACSAKTGVQ